jgi:NitT/TauT family transport system permease protein
MAERVASVDLGKGRGEDDGYGVPELPYVQPTIHALGGMLPPSRRPPHGVKGRGRKQSAVLRLRGDVPYRVRVASAAVGALSLVVVWLVAAARTPLVPTPVETWDAGVALWREGVLWDDLRASCRRMAYGYGISISIAVVVGVLMGSFRSAESYFESPIAFLRYIPATALLPIFLFWLGIDEPPKIALIVVGTVFFNILMIADVVRAVPRELISVSYTLGASRTTVLRRVVLPHSLPGMIDVARINLAAGWLMLVVAELIAAPDGLAYRLTRAQRFRQIDRMFALLVVFGLIGVVSDLFLRWLRNRTAPWARP